MPVWIIQVHLAVAIFTSESLQMFMSIRNWGPGVSTAVSEPIQLPFFVTFSAFFTRSMDRIDGTYTDLHPDPSGRNRMAVTLSLVIVLVALFFALAAVMVAILYKRHMTKYGFSWVVCGAQKVAYCVYARFRSSLCLPV